jgi:hypothetical protein
MPFSGEWPLMSSSRPLSVAERTDAAAVSMNVSAPGSEQVKLTTVVE